MPEPDGLCYVPGGLTYCLNLHDVYCNCFGFMSHIVALLLLLACPSRVGAYITARTASAWPPFSS